ncbi:MAG: glycosyltransferase family 2 protein [Bacteroidetes bacterium]|nr:glycosyltransferase family 2 protein [Bacteroidota bacterium]
MVETLVSICIPAYKQIFFLKKCLDSVFMQTYKKYEVILTDDTPDDTIRIFLKENYPDKKIEYYKNDKALGSPANWNYAISKAKGNYIKILHHDDYFTNKDSLQKFVNELDNNKNVEFVFSLSAINNAGTETNWFNTVTPQMLEKTKVDPTYLICGNFMGSPSATIYRRNSVLFDEKLKWVVDLDFYIASLLNNKRFAFINEALITTTNEAQHQITNSCINNPEVELFEFCYLLDKYKEAIQFNDDLEKVFLNLFYNYNISSIDELSRYYKNAGGLKNFYTKVFKAQRFYNLKRTSISTLKNLFEKNIKK